MKDSAEYAPEADLLIRVAEQGFFTGISIDTKRTVSFLLQSMFVADRYLDPLSAADRDRAQKEILTYLGSNKSPLHGLIDGETRATLKDLKAVLIELPDVHRRAFVKSVAEVFNNGSIVATTRDPREFIVARKREARATADMILSLVPELGRNVSFAKFLRHVTIAETLLDSLKDAAADKKQGEIAVKPIQIYFHLAAGAIKHTAVAAKMHPRILSFLYSGLGWSWQHIKVSLASHSGVLKTVSTSPIPNVRLALGKKKLVQPVENLPHMHRRLFSNDKLS